MNQDVHLEGTITLAAHALSLHLCIFSTFKKKKKKTLTLLLLQL